jgi:hypothetical protein
MARKVKLAIFDNDLKATFGKYPLSKDGSKIVVTSGGGANWAPSFDNNSFIEFPKSRWKGGGHERIYLVKKKGSKCVNFSSDPPTIPGPSEEQLKEAMGSVAFGNLGKEDKESMLINYITLAIVFIVLLSQLGVFR